MAQKLTFDRFGVDLQVPTDIRPFGRRLESAGLCLLHTIDHTQRVSMTGVGGNTAATVDSI
ncbi:hypothetical protein HED50_23750 [Ochrobactrum oryzae]|nr:hypothetical protein [Brucella oryzae]